MQQRVTLTDKQKSYLLAASLAVLNLLIFLLSPLGSYSFEDKKISLPLAIISVCLYLLHIILCIILRFQKKIWIARGLFLYQLVGAAAYIIFFVGYIAGNGQSAFFDGAYDIFRWWTLWYEPFTVTLSRLIGIPLKFTMGILYLILIELSGTTVTAIRKDLRYERERAEDRAHEEATKGRGGHW